MTNESTYRSWTLGPVFYSIVAVAEALGRSGKAQVIDLQSNSGSPFTPGYAIYDNGNLEKVALFNYMNDPTGAAAYVATLSIAGNTPATVSVKYLLADSVSQKFNITWAGQVRTQFYLCNGDIDHCLTLDPWYCAIRDRHVPRNSRSLVPRS